jgi:hypothetical protein
MAVASVAECDSCEGVYDLAFKEIQATGEKIPNPRCPYCGCTDFYDAPKGAVVKVGNVDPSAVSAVRPAGRGGPRPARVPVAA